MVRTVRPLESFRDDYRKLSPENQTAVDDALHKLLENPASKKLRFEKLRGYKNPSIYTIHVHGNHSYKISMEIQGDVAILRRVHTHREIDRAP